MISMADYTLPFNMPKRQKAFTLIEIIVVLIILGVLVATALPSLFDWVRKSPQTTEALVTMSSLKAQIVSCLRGHVGSEVDCLGGCNLGPNMGCARAIPQDQGSEHFTYIIYNSYCTCPSPNDINCCNLDPQGWLVYAFSDSNQPYPKSHIYLTGNANDTVVRCMSYRRNAPGQPLVPDNAC